MQTSRHTLDIFLDEFLTILGMVRNLLGLCASPIHSGFLVTEGIIMGSSANTYVTELVLVGGSLASQDCKL